MSSLVSSGWAPTQRRRTRSDPTQPYRVSARSNARIACGLLPSLQLSSAWKEQRSAAAAIPEDLVREAVQRAEKELTSRQQFEYRMWADKGGVDPKSSQGTAAAFSKANKQALYIANSSLLFEYASEELINSLQTAGPSGSKSSGGRQRRQIIDNLIGFTRDDILSGDGLQVGGQYRRATLRRPCQKLSMVFM